MSELTITRVHDLLLRGTDDMPFGLYHFNLAKAEQLCRLHYKAGSIKAVQARLKDLEDAGYIQHDIPKTKEMNAKWYYTMMRKGLDYLAGLGLEVNEALRDSKEVDKNPLFLEHAFGLTDVIIAFALSRKVDMEWYLHSFIHERILQRKAYKAAWMVNGQLESVKLIPDAFLDLRKPLPNGKYLRMPILLEYDRDTEHEVKFKNKIRAYTALLQTGAYKQHFGVNAITVAFTTFAGEPRLKQMLEWTRQEVAESKELSQTFLFSYLPVPLEPRQLLLEPCWFTPFEAEARALVEM